MNFTYRRRLVVCLIFFIFYDAVVLVIVNGQPTTDDKKLLKTLRLHSLERSLHISRDSWLYRSTRLQTWKDSCLRCLLRSRIEVSSTL